MHFLPLYIKTFSILITFKKKKDFKNGPGSLHMHSTIFQLISNIFPSLLHTLAHTHKEKTVFIACYNQFVTGLLHKDNSQCSTVWGGTTRSHTLLAHSEVKSATPLTHTHCYILSVSNLIWLQCCTVSFIQRLFGRRPLSPLKHTHTSLSSFPVLLSCVSGLLLHRSALPWELGKTVWPSVRTVCDIQGRCFNWKSTTS